MLLGRRADKDYLGLKEEAKSFALRDLTVPFLLVEVYNELCFTCQEEMPTFNDLFRAIKADGELKHRLKMIGLRVGSTPRAVVKFRREKGVLFPLFADHHREIFDC
ncbi:MAG: redoxin domain-containing protein, partial [Chlorobiales bacterium]|nr:redoxin domain-containing protein [Chlorobiales bacterium]